jgi:hypothetical protein
MAFGITGAGNCPDQPGRFNPQTGVGFKRQILSTKSGLRLARNAAKCPVKRGSEVFCEVGHCIHNVNIFKKLRETLKQDQSSAKIDLTSNTVSNNMYFDGGGSVLQLVFRLNYLFDESDELVNPPAYGSV